METLDR